MTAEPEPAREGQAPASWIERLLEPGGLRPHFQTIVRQNGAGFEPVACECLMRGPEGSNLERADALFGYVRFKGAEPAIDRRCLRVALGAFAPIAPPGVALAFNLHAQTLARDPFFVDALEAELAREGWSCERLIVELVEQSRALDRSSAAEGVRRLRARGVRLAL